jgi:hypothetical protein
VQLNAEVQAKQLALWQVTQLEGEREDPGAGHMQVALSELVLDRPKLFWQMQVLLTRRKVGLHCAQVVLPKL